MRFCLALFVALLLAASHAQATDGVLEINQTCAVNTGCFAGDTAGYPVTIDGTAGRSYRLTSDLIVPNENTDGIRVSTSDIGIDLNNFAIIRSGCEGATTNCTPGSGSGSGIERSSSANRGISVKNGSITGMGSFGVFLGDQAEVTGLRIRWNRIHGISAGAGSTVSEDTAYQNGFDGIDAGIGSTVSENNAYQNGDDGIYASLGSTFSGNTAYNNGDDGIVASTGSTVSGNTCYFNTGDGISTSPGATVQRNTVRSNGGYGLRLGSESAYRENVITSNTTGTVTGGVNMFSNSCNGTTTCP